MKYTVTCLTPTLVGDGQKLSPIDYMVWKDHVNVLDQRRIFKLLARGPRLDSYLSQLKKADRLDFASWGGFAQNFAGRRIPFEHSSLTAHWQRLAAENLFIPTFAASPAGNYLPATSIKGALRTSALFKRWSHDTMEDAAKRSSTERIMRRVSSAEESAALGASGADRMKFLAAADSSPVPNDEFKVYMLRVATMQARGAGKFELGWKQSPRGTVDGRRPDDSTPMFVEMASPGAKFEGHWQERDFYKQPEITRSLHWKTPDHAYYLAAANDYAAAQLKSHREYAAALGLNAVAESIARVESRLEQVRGSSNSCLLCIGYGGGFLSKASYTDTGDEAYRQILRGLPFFARAIQSGLPFPKTRKIVFLSNQAGTVPGWVELNLGE